MEAFAIFEHNDEIVPVYLSYDAKLSEEETEKLISDSVEDYRKKHKDKEKSKKKNNKIGALSTSLDYKPTATALKLVSSKKGTPIMYTEYRVYKSSGTSKRNYYYLRADHQSKEAFLYGYKAQWYPDVDNMDLLDPEPVTKSNQYNISISIPLAIQWTLDLNNSTDIDMDFDIERDHAVWCVEDYVPALGRYPMMDFQFTQGANIESKPSNNGFKMDVYYEGWHSSGFRFNYGTPAWKIIDTIIYNDSKDNLGYED